MWTDNSCFTFPLLVYSFQKTFFHCQNLKHVHMTSIFWTFDLLLINPSRYLLLGVYFSLHQRTLHEKTYFLFPNVLKRWSSKNKMHWNKVFVVVLLGKMIFLFLEDIILFFRRKMKDHFSQKDTRENDIFCMLGKDGISFSYKNDITLLSKNPRRSSPEKCTLEMTFLVSLKKMIFIIENMVFPLIGKLNMIKKFTQSNTHREN